MSTSTSVGQLVATLLAEYQTILDDEQLAQLATAGSLQLILASCAMRTATTLDGHITEHLPAAAGSG